MSDELTQEEIAEILQAGWWRDGEQREQESRVIQYIAALRAKVEALEKERDRLNSECELWGTNYEDVHTQLATMKAERNRLKKALRKINRYTANDPLADCAMRQWAGEALRGEGG